MTAWNPDKYLIKKPFIEARARMLRQIRSFFDSRGYLEVETPALQTAPCMEAHIQAFRAGSHYLHTSPEFAMKKLLVAGLPKIYQLCHAFRDEAPSRLHSPEFTMLEWYQAGMDYKAMMQETIDLIRAVAQEPMRHGGKTSDAQAEWEILTVAEAMRKYAAVDIEPLLDDAEGLKREAACIGVDTGSAERWDDVFFRIFLDRVEPHLGSPAPTVICDYPVSMAALARPKPEDPRWCERFEIYICGIELCNAFGELTDAKVQRERFLSEVKLRKELYGADYPVDEDFLSAIDYGLPQSSGNALGIDRLAMLVTGARNIADVQALPVAQ